ncbi:sulfatase [Niabella ginsengisoli]|uniref:Sulfatase n=1 Tax=Niabella ginsengisoli TaxID=522298 RepID=A0ABS9SIQ2_9BACT|nr:sulfatase [Niabella ginsengisoli]MCH5598239.1 sulfatase [Niabella ginsengisoli]
MKKIIYILLLFIAITSNAQQKPNIVYILADDMGWKDAGFTGSDFYLTPNLDKLAKQGMVFTNAYAAAGNCAPSRACFVSGQYTPRHGVYAVTSTKRGPVKQMRLEPIPNSEEVAPSVYTIAEGLHDAGYRTAIFGKWHLGKRAGTLPGDQGFDVDGSFNPPDDKDFQETNDPKGIYRITNGACEFMEKNKDHPFFIYVSHHATHMSIQARKEMLDKFNDKAGKLQKNKRFAAMNTQMDDGIGILLQKIKDLGIEDNTLIIFTSDNGGLPQSPQAPLRGYKGMYYEGGIRVPFIARWPKTIKAGTVQNTPIIMLLTCLPHLWTLIKKRFHQIKFWMARAWYLYSNKKKTLNSAPSSGIFLVISISQTLAHVMMFSEAGLYLLLEKEIGNFCYSMKNGCLMVAAINLLKTTALSCTT